MKHQPALLFDDLYREPLAAPEARARSTDPESSKAAAERMNASGEAKDQRERVVDLVFANPGKTSKELSERTDELEYHQIARRLKEAEAEGAIVRRKNGKAPVTWWPKAEPAEWAD